MEAVISVVDDDESVRESTGILLRSAGYRVATFESAELFLASTARLETACLVLDIRMPVMDGLELQRRLSISDTDLPIIFVTAHDEKIVRQRALNGGTVNFFAKPFSAVDFLAAIETALAMRPEHAKR